jgi:hypothetical protein
MEFEVSGPQQVLNELDEVLTAYSDDILALVQEHSNPRTPVTMAEELLKTAQRQGVALALLNQRQG